MSRPVCCVGTLTLLALVLAQASDLRRDETVVLFPTAARFDPERREWETELHGWVFEPEARTVSVALLRETLGLGGLEWDEESRRHFKRRARWFLVDNERDKRVTVTVAGHEFALPRSDANGHFTARVRWPDPQPEYGDSNRTEACVIPVTVTAGRAAQRRSTGRSTGCRRRGCRSFRISTTRSRSAKCGIARPCSGTRS
jgi:hypothetical protein